MIHDKITVYIDNNGQRTEWFKVERHFVENLPRMYPGFNFRWVDHNYNTLIAEKKIGLPYHVQNDIYNDKDLKLNFEHLRKNQNWQPYDTC